MTPRQREALDFIVVYERENRCTPSMAEISAALNLKSRSNAHRIVSRLIEQGKLVKTPRRRRSIALPATSLRTIPTGDLIDELHRRGVSHG